MTQAQALGTCQVWQPHPDMYLVVEDITRVVYTVTRSAGRWHVSDRGSDTDPSIAAQLLATLRLL